MTEAAVSLARCVRRRRASTSSSSSELHDQEEIEVQTSDGWTLVLTRYRPRPQPFPQPLLGRAAPARARLHAEPPRLEHRRVREEHAVLRRRPVPARAARPRQERARAAAPRARAPRGSSRPPTSTIGWDLDSHLLFDLPAAVAAVKRASGREKIFYCGHSLGGILGYAYATLVRRSLGADHDRRAVGLRAPAAVAARAVVRAAASAFPAVDVALAAANFARVAGRALRRLPGLRPPTRAFTPWRFKRLPFRAAFRWLEENLRSGVHAPLTGGMPFSRPLLYQPRNVALGALRPLLREGANDEPRATLEQLARWARRGELTSQAPAPRHRGGVPAHPHPARDLLRRRGPAGVGADHAQRVPLGVERVSALASGARQQSPRPDDGLRHPADLLRREEPDDVRARPREARPPRCRAAAARADTDRWSSTWSGTARCNRGDLLRANPPLSERGARRPGAGGAARAGPLRPLPGLAARARAGDRARCSSPDAGSRWRPTPASPRGPHGALDGLAPDEARRRHPEFYRSGRTVLARLAATGRTAPGGETRAEFVARARVAHALVREPLFDPTARALVVSHGGLLAFLIALLLGHEPRDEASYGFDNCGVRADHRVPRGTGVRSVRDAPLRLTQRFAAPGGFRARRLDPTLGRR